MERLTRQRWIAALLLAALLVAAIGFVAWTRNDTPIHRGFLVACAAFALLNAATYRWRAGFFGPAARGAIAYAVFPLLMHIFYRSAPLVSAAWFQGVAIWILALLVAMLLQLALCTVLVHRADAAR